MNRKLVHLQTNQISYEMMSLILKIEIGVMIKTSN